MEAKNMEGNSKSEGKKRTKMSVGGDVGGLVVVGGALAIAGLFATLVVNRHKTKDSNGNTYKPVKGSQKSNNYWRMKNGEDYGSQGLRCLLQLQTSSLADSSNYRGDGESSTISVTTQEDRVMSQVNDGLKIEEMVLPNDLEKEIVVLCDDLCAIQDKYSIEDEIPIETDEENEEVNSVEEDREEEEEDEEYVAENENESFGDKSNSSMDLKADAVWPAEIIEDTESETCEPEKGVVEKAKTVDADKHTHFNGDIFVNNDITEKSTKVNEPSEHSSKVRVSILSMLMVAMFVLLLEPVSRKAISVVLSLLSYVSKHCC